MTFLFPGNPTEAYVQVHGRKVSEVMTTDVASVTAHSPLDDIVGLMEERNIKHLPVLSKGRVIGIVSRSDLLRILVIDAVLSQSQRHFSDSAIWKNLLAEIGKSLATLYDAAVQPL
jgi:signal-transduction protein with cAMP-binding, CBS, and nucleotidyltransferase domain